MQERCFKADRKRDDIMDGVINIYKPVGMTSFDVVRDVRKLSGIKKVGHAGTLDPAASGVLPVCIGRATKIIDYIMNETKVYKVELRLGVTTDTYDREGAVISSSDVNSSEEDIVSVISSFTGEIEQIPPMYSALKVKGKKLYELARSGITIERQSRRITIHNINITRISIPYVDFEVTCSKGTYIRSLCFDIGEVLGCGGMLNALERTATGNFSKDQSVIITSLTRDNISNYVISMDEALRDFKIFTVNEKFERLLFNGVAVKDRQLLQFITEDSIYRVYNENNILIGLGKKTNDSFSLIKLLT
jgi:tRNA pseudouridine55 synthase